MAGQPVERAASLAASAGGQESKRPKFTIWPEWNDVDVNAEKWVPWMSALPSSPVQGSKDAKKKGPPSLDAGKKEDKKGKSPTVQPGQHYFDDPEGKIEMPPSLRVDSWKRPTDFIHDKNPLVVDTDNVPHGFDLITNNEHLHESEFLRYCISQIMALWEMSAVAIPPEGLPEPIIPGDDPTHSWRPWEHIYSLCKAGKGPHLPLYNSHGKYLVRLYWMGCWRKITIDDSIPFDDQGRMLLPCTTLQHELWPMLLTKALIKVASLDYAGGNPSQEFGDVSVLQCLTGWIPEAIPLQQSHKNEVWELMKMWLPEWKLPLQEWEKPPEPIDAVCKESTQSDGVAKEEKPEKETSQKDPKEGKEKPKEGKDKKDGKEKDKGGKEDKKDKKGDKEKDKSKGKEKEKLQEEKTSIDDFVIPEKPEIVMFATYSSTPKYPVKVSVLGEMADASEKLRQNGLSHMYPHPVCITQTRSCPLEPPPPPVVIPSWKLIRPRKKKLPPHDEPVPEPEPPKPIQCLEVTSPFVNYKVSPVPIPTDTHRPKSALMRGGARSRTDTDGATIEEGDESAPTPRCVSPDPKPPPPPVEELQKSQSGKGVKPGSATKDRSPPKRPESRQSNADKTEVKVEKKDVPKADHPPPGAPPITNNASGGLAPPQLGEPGSESTVPMPGDESLVEEQVHVEEMPKAKRAWMDFDIFFKCFRTLYVFHKHQTYLCNQRYSDLKNVTQSAPAGQGKAEKKPVQASPAVSDSPLSETVEQVNSYAPADSSSPFYLFVDNLQATDIVVSFSVLSRWFDPLPAPIEERERKSQTHIGQSKDKDLDKDQTNMSVSLDDKSVAGEQKPPPQVTPGSLVAEPYSWKSLVTGQPILRLRTTGTKSTVLSLPPGRHVLRFMMNSPLGHHVHMCSTVNFVFGDEETVMPQLTNESCRFRDSAAQVIMNLGKCIMGFADTEQFKTAWAELERSHCPYLDNKQLSKTHHYQIFKESLYQMLRKTIKDVITPEVAFAWRAFTFDATTPNILAIPVGSRPETIAVTDARSQNTVRESKLSQSILQMGKTSKTFLPPSQTAFDVQLQEFQATGSASHRGSAKPSSKKQGGEAEKPENPWANREPTVDELIASVKIQKVWRGYWTRKLLAARTQGTDENLKAAENLAKCWHVLENSVEDNGLMLLREMFKRDSEIMPHYPFYKDEWNKISYADYKGVFPDQPSMNWFLVFRDIFHVKEEMLVVPRLYVPISTCMLRVIDNDTGQEIPRVFQKVAPYVYKKNKKGYSFVAEARTVEQPLPSGDWRMRLIGSLSALPAPSTGDVCCNFATKEIKDYYVPNSKNIIFRQAVKVTEDHFASLQVNTSKHDVYIKLSVLDNEEEVISAVGKGHVVIPAFTFLKNITQEDIEKTRSGSRAFFTGSQASAISQDELSQTVSRGALRYTSLAEDGPQPQIEMLFDIVDLANKGAQIQASKPEKSTSKLKRAESAVSNDQQSPSRNSMRSEAELAERLEDTRVHKYIIQATVLQNSWPLSESSWRFVQMLKEMEKNELKISNKERPPSPPKVEKTPAGGGKGKPKGGKDRGSKDKLADGKGSRPSSQQFDITKPHWTLRVVSDAVAAEEIEVKKDTERADEIRAIKKAWEDAEPGRAAKAQQARLKYLNEHTIKLTASDDVSVETAVQSGESVSEMTGKAELTAKTESVSKTDSQSRVETTSSVVEVEQAPSSQTPVSSGEHESDMNLTLEPPPLPQPKEMLEPVDLTPFIRKTLPEPRYLDENEIQRLVEKRQQEIADYKAFREGVEKWREADKQNRNKTKLQQLEEYQALQAALDAARERVNIPREAIRTRFLDAEKQRLEELANQEAAMKAELEAKSPKGRKKSAAGKKKK